MNSTEVITGDVGKKKVGNVVKTVFLFLARSLGTGRGGEALSIFPAGMRADPPRPLDEVKEVVARGVGLPPTQDLTLVFCDLVVSNWRLRRKMRDPRSGEPRKEMLAAHAHLEQAFKALSAAGVEVQDHDDTEYDSGLPLKVLDFQEVPGIGSEKVIETLKPTIYHRGEVIQNGVVIVGTPPADDTGEDE